MVAFAAGPTEAAKRSTATPPVFGAPVHVDDDFPAAEPSLKVGPDDTYWITAPNFPGAVLGDPIHQGITGDLVWSSTDHGQTWTLHTTPDPILGGLDADVFVDPTTAQVFVSGLWIGCFSVAASLDTAGSAFNDQPLACGSQVGDDRQWITTVAGTDLYGAFGSDPFCCPADIYLQHATILPGGALIPDPAPIKLSDTNTGPDAYQWPGYLAADQTTGDVYVTWNTQGDEKNGVNDKVVIARIQPDGTVTKAEIPTTGDTFDSFTAVDLDTAGNLYVVWNERHGGNRTDTMLSYSSDHGTRWAAPIVVNSASVPTTVFPWVAAGDPGRVDVVYYGSTSPAPSPQETPADATWDVYMAQSLNVLSTSTKKGGRRPSAPTFLEVKATPSPMHVGGICTSGTDCGSSDRDLLDYFMVDVDSRGYAAIAYAEDGDTTTAQIRFLGQIGGPGLYARQ